MTARQACNISYAAIVDGLDDQQRKDVDYALAAEPGKPAKRPRGAQALLTLMANPPGRR